MIEIKEHEILVTHVKGSGPGGQNRNKRMSGVRIKHLPTGIVVTATERRSQEQNRTAALERLKLKLEERFRKPKPRIKTRVTRLDKQRRLDAKKKVSMKKEIRRVSGGKFES